MIKELKQIQEIARDAEAKLQRITSGNVGHTANTVRQQLILINQLVEVVTNGKQYAIHTLDDALEAAAEEVGVTVEEIKGKSQKVQVVRARHLFLITAYNYVEGATLESVANWVNRTHLITRHAINKPSISFEFEKLYNQFIKKIAS